MRYRINREVEAESERELIGLINEAKIVKDIERSCKWEILEGIRKNLIRNDESEFDDGIMNEDGYRISLESFSKDFYQN